MNKPSFNEGKYYDENGNIIDKKFIRGKYFGYHCGNGLCDVKQACMWDTHGGKFVCFACAKEINVRTRFLLGPDSPDRCIQAAEPKS